VVQVVRLERCEREGKVDVTEVEAVYSDVSIKT
jgi:hypothetical protein